MAVSTSRMVTIVGRSGSGRACNFYRGPGTEEISNLLQQVRETVAIMSRGDYMESVQGKQIFPQLTLQVYDEGDLTDAGSAKPMDLVRKTGAFASDTTTDANPSAWAFRLEITITNPDVGTSYIVLPNCFPTNHSYTMAVEGNSISVPVECRGTPVIT